MRSLNEQDNLIESASFRELKVLSEVDENPELTQRELSRSVGTALGLTNVLLRHLVQQGYVRATRASWKRWLYTLTPDGVAHKIRLTVAYINRVLHHYRRVRVVLKEQLELLTLNEESRVAILGTAEIAELVYLGLREIGIEEIDIFGSRDQCGGKFLGMPINDVATLLPEEYDRVLVASLGSQDLALTESVRMSVIPDNLVTFFADGKAKERV